MTLEQAICECTRKAEANRELAKYNKSHVDRANDLKNAEECEQLAAWLRELQERRKSDSCEGCEGCKNIGLWENEYEYGVSCPCLRCARRAKDNYEPERRTE